MGQVVVNRRSKDSLNHGRRRIKVQALYLAPEIVATGRVLDARTRDGITTYVIGAPIKIGGEAYIGSAVVRRDENTQRLYVHDVWAERGVRTANKTAARADESDELHGAKPGLVRTVLHQTYSVNPDAVSKVVDDNGEPLVVYHGTSADFNAFSDWRPTFFTADRRCATAYGDNVMEAYLSIKQPLDPSTDEAARQLYNEEFLPEVADMDGKPLEPGQMVPFQYADDFFGFLYEKEHTQGFRTTHEAPPMSDANHSRHSSTGWLCSANIASTRSASAQRRRTVAGENSRVAKKCAITRSSGKKTDCHGSGISNSHAFSTQCFVSAALQLFSSMAATATGQHDSGMEWIAAKWRL